MEKQYLTLGKIAAYNESYELGNYVWKMVMGWDSFAKWTLGKQLVNSADSISANIAEGFGRYHKKEKIHFYRYSYGSLKETQDWIKKAKERDLVNEKDATYITQKLEQLPKLINHLIKYTNEKLKY